MHRKLKKLLHDATGESGFVVVVFLDVRGFSAWMTDPTQSALYLKSVYTHILDDYFPTASFFKPTGDGLLVVLDHDENNLKEIVQQAVEQSVKLVDDFSTITGGDPMINFPVPEGLGVGIARGSATRLVSKKQTLDYSGGPLNLAARLMDLARPSGVVFDATLGIELLHKDTAALFEEQRVFVKGLAEETPMFAHVLANRVVVPEANRYPLNRFEEHVEEAEVLTFKQLSERELFLHELTREPADPEKIITYVRFPQAQANGRQHPTLFKTWEFRATLTSRQGRKFAGVEYHPIIRVLKRNGIKPGWRGSVWLEYPVRPTAS